MREAIGVVFQSASLDKKLTVRENLEALETAAAAYARDHRAVWQA